MATIPNSFRGTRMRSKRLERLMTSGLVESYGQRVHLSFEYLVLDDRAVFTLKDLAERGKVVFGFLSIPGHDNSFAIMDSFRQFDRGGGAVSLEDFGVGVVERLFQFYNNNSLLKNIARELIPSGRRSVSEVVACLESENTLSALFNANLGAHLNAIRRAVDEVATNGALAGAAGSLPGGLVSSVSNITNNGASMDYISVSRFIECIQRAIDESCAEVCAALHLSSRRRKQLQDESITGYHYCVGAGEALLTAALGSYKWEIGYPFWGGTKAKLEKLLEGAGSDRDSDEGVEEANPDELGEELSDGEGPQRVMLGGLEMLLPKAKAEKAIDLDEVQLYLLNKAQTAMNQFICLLSDPDSPMVLQEVEQDMATDTVSSQLDKLVSSKLAGTNKVKTISSGGTEIISPRPGDKNNEVRRSDVSAGDANEAALLQQLLATQDKLMRAQIRLQVYQKMPVSDTMGTYDQEDEHEANTSSSSEYESEVNASSDGSDEVSDAVESVSRHSNASPFSHASVGGDEKLKSKEGRHARILTPPKRHKNEVSDAESDEDRNSELDSHNFDSDSEKHSHSSYSSDADIVSDSDVSTSSPSRAKCEVKRPLRKQVTEIPLDVIESQFTELDELLTNVAGEDYILGTMLERSCALIPYEMMPQASKASGAVVNAAERETIQPFSSAAPVDASAAGNQQPKEIEKPAVPISAIMRDLELPDISAMGHMLLKLKGTIDERKHFEQTQEAMQMKLSMCHERISEVTVQLEQARRERDDAVSQAVEVQILREKNIRLTAEEANLHHLQQKNSELSRTVAELQRNLKETTELYSKAHIEENMRSQNFKQSTLIGGDASSKALQKQIHDLTSQRDRISKENQRIVLASKQADQRMKAALQDHLSLRQKLNKAEDELLSSKTVISNLLGEIDHERSLRGDRDTLVRKAQELHMEVVELRGVVEESRVAKEQLIKTKEELSRAEDQIALLEEKLDDITKEAELSNIGQDQLDNLRAAVAQKAKENRELVVQTHNLERRLQELQGLETRHSDLCDEVTELKFKVDQMPPLLAELARLRGSHRATTRVLHEQEKLVTSLRSRSSELEADNARLKAQNRIIEDLQAKLRHSEEDCRRYAEQTREIPELNAQIKKLQEDYRSVDSSHRKLRKIMRQTAITGGAHAHTDGPAGVAER